MPRWTEKARAEQSERTKRIKPWIHSIKPQTYELLKGEFEDERLVRVYAERNIDVIFDFSPVDGFYHRVKKGRWCFKKNPISNLFECQICKKVGTSKAVCERSGIYGWDCEKQYGCAYGKSKTRLCMGCFNRVRAIVKKQNEAEKNRLFLNKIKGAIRDERKNRQRQNQDDGGIEGLSR